MGNGIENWISKKEKDGKDGSMMQSVWQLLGSAMDEQIKLLGFSFARFRRNIENGGIEYWTPFRLCDFNFVLLIFAIPRCFPIFFTK